MNILKNLTSINNQLINVVAGPCMGRCQHAPTVCVGKNYVDNASVESVKDAIKNKNFEAVIPRYTSLEEYKENGGYKISQQIKEGLITDEQIISSLKDSGLKGKGGAGFPTGMKWEIVSKYSGKKYVAVNGDEGEPGTFKDRNYLEKDPHRFLEGALIASLFIKASNVYIYMRDEYPGINIFGKIKIKNNTFIGHNAINSIR